MAGLGSNAVDVVILNDAPPLLCHRVLRDGVRLLHERFGDSDPLRVSDLDDPRHVPSGHTW